jgi:hypothetical protein
MHAAARCWSRWLKWPAGTLDAARRAKRWAWASRATRTTARGAPRSRRSRPCATFACTGSGWRWTWDAWSSPTACATSWRAARSRRSAGA